MIIIKDRPGQLCNRLWAFTPFINYGIEHNTKVVVLYFGDYYDYFDNLKIFKNISFVRSRTMLRIYRLMFKLLERLPKSMLSLFGVIYEPDPYNAKMDYNKGIVIIDSWNREKPDVSLKTDEIQKLFLPKLDFRDKVDDIIAVKKESFDIIIGVHIRRGDYKKYRNGRYYYSDPKFVDFLSQLTKEFDQNLKLAFLICSNEKINLEAYSDYFTFQIPDTNLMEDLYALSKCDYIFGPLSSFSMWASFYGQKPLLFIKSSNTKLRLKDFSIIASQGRFKNGKVYTH